MALILLFLLSLILSLLNIEPLTIAGVLLNICFFPGFCLFALIKKEELVFDDLILAFPCSIGISGLVTLGMLSIGVPVKYVPAIIYISVGVAILFYLIVKRRDKVCLTVKLIRQESIFMLLAALITLILSIPYFIGPNRASFAAHALHHSSFVSQILNGIFPPENPGLGGTSIGYYWGFHSLIAALASQTDFHQLQIIFTLNALSLYFIFGLTYSFARAFNLSEGYRYIMPLAFIGLMRSDAGLYFIYKLFQGSSISVEHLKLQQFIFPTDVLNSWLEGLYWYDTRLFPLNKFYNISAMPAAICLCLSYLLILSLLIKRKSIDKVYLIGLSIVIAACILIYPPLAIVLLLHAPIWSFYIFISGRGNYREKAKEIFNILIPYCIGILTVLHYLISVMASRDVSSGGQGGVVSFAFYFQSVRNLIVFLIPAPIILYGVWVAFRRFSFSREFFFLVLGTGLCLGLSLFTRWPFDNSYKFNYILIIFLSIFFVIALSDWASSLSSRLFTRSVFISVILLLLSGPVIVEAAYIVSCLSTDRFLTFSKRHIVYAQDKRKNEAYEWIRGNTPRNSLIMLSYIENTFPCCGNNRNYEVAALTERNLYVIKDLDYTTSNPEYAKRVLFREKLFNNPEDPDVISFFISLNRPVYLLVEDGLPDLFLVEDRFKHFPEHPGTPFELVFRNERQRVYRLRFNEQNPADISG
jgi:hypothetical protein